jgi:hypothetical protein
LLFAIAIFVFTLRPMLDEREQEFIRYWEANRLREKRLDFQLLAGIPVGLIFALPVLLLLFSGRFWYKRADMDMNTMLSPYVLVSAIFLIVVFVAVFYKRHQWDMKEQQYLELKAKDQKHKSEQQ